VICVINWYDIEILIQPAIRNTVGRFTAITAALVAAVYPPLIWSTSAFLTESLFTFLFLTYIYTIILALDQDSLAATGISGIFFGAAVLTKPQLAPFFFVPFVLARFQQKKKEHLKQAVRLVRVSY